MKGARGKGGGAGEPAQLGRNLGVRPCPLLHRLAHSKGCVSEWKLSAQEYGKCVDEFTEGLRTLSRMKSDRPWRDGDFEISG